MAKIYRQLAEEKKASGAAAETLSLLASRTVSGSPALTRARRLGALGEITALEAVFVFATIQQAITIAYAAICLPTHCSSLTRGQRALFASHPEWFS